MADQQGALGEYLCARRGVLTPEQVGLPADPQRRVAGLRRDEVAALAGISREYYVRLEQGRDNRPSMQVISALARALQLDEFAVRYLVRLATPQAPRPQAAGPLPDAITGRLLEQWPDSPALVLDPNRDIVASNSLARALVPESFQVGMNLMLNTFLPGARTRHPDWSGLVSDHVAALRFYSDPTDPRRQEIVAQLLREQPEFARCWARHDARPFSDRTFRVPIEGVGEVELNIQLFSLPVHFGYELMVVFPTPGSPAASALAYLAARGTGLGVTPTRFSEPDAPTR
ncbi:helix-turn-helix domain-containing protein [Salinibacterium sp. NK8237]|uniref:helix-turn-helix domain-containing protein n=1 Tax=Salinibacterium sp. NK8237 TaxID=2792038 RepID=UPI0018CD82C2|nr:helix-turn-helix transcriptional regulator [Salinibacterium sp. NK8237]MBH0129531.1 helix-turn-helix domain-containing protein [Salinibacterium sp. NK8237]